MAFTQRGEASKSHYNTPSATQLGQPKDLCRLPRSASSHFTSSVCGAKMLLIVRTRRAVALNYSLNRHTGYARQIIVCRVLPAVILWQYLATNFLPSSSKIICCSSGDSYDSCLQLLCGGSCDCVRHYLGIAGSTCPAVSCACSEIAVNATAEYFGNRLNDD